MSKRNAKEFKQIKRELWTKIDDIYTQGFDDGVLSCKPNEGDLANKSFELGMNISWFIARWLYAASVDEVIMLFGGCSHWVNFSAQEAYDIVYNYIMKGEVPKYD